MAIDGVTPNARSTDPTTSVDAGRSVDRAHSQQYVQQTLRVFGPMADHELVAFAEDDSAGQEAFGKFSPQRLRSARSELVELCEVIQTTAYRNTPSGRRAHVWAINPKALTPAEKLAALERIGDVLIVDGAPLFNLHRLQDRLGFTVSDLVPLTPEQRARLTEVYDEVEEITGSSDLVSLLHYLALGHD
ncbi:hypothetical protein MUN78_10055 [Leucobacter allii]|uniref:Uncharacterized protein n=1 Tax=Leucobacter allii TaxID=2932247 RepID=A0ABY4FHA6_9MICO|nr:hypothetical protein [Leucobacter allii]UOQ56046.1 hypothetical protein MUN78_10055 [Leucobacter allii]